MAEDCCDAMVSMDSWRSLRAWASDSSGSPGVAVEGQSAVRKDGVVSAMTDLCMSPKYPMRST